MHLHRPNSGGAGRRLKLELAAKELAASGASREEIIDVLDSLAGCRPEVTRALAAIEEVV